MRRALTVGLISLTSACASSRAPIATDVSELNLGGGSYSLSCGSDCTQETLLARAVDLTLQSGRRYFVVVNSGMGFDVFASPGLAYSSHDVNPIIRILGFASSSGNVNVTIRILDSKGDDENALDAVQTFDSLHSKYPKGFDVSDLSPAAQVELAQLRRES